jgi:phosphatidylglycerol:prolipoprotein diacylglycerol transferase
MEQYDVLFPGLGLAFSIDRVALRIGSFPIYWYGLLIAAGMLLAVWFAFRHAAEFGIDTDRLLDVLCIGTVMAIVCARIYYVATSPYAYASVWEMLDIRQGGIAIYGSLFGAFVFGGLACRWRKIPMLATFDLVAMGFLIGQCIGRWGNFVNQEAFGYNTALPWGMYSVKTQEYLESAVVTLPAGMTVDPSLPVHPTFLYESLWCLAGFVLLRLYFKKRKFNGDVALRYAIWYGAGRFWIEGLRTDSLLLVPSLGLRISQVVAAATVAVSLLLEILLTRKYRSRQPLAVKLALSSENLKRWKLAAADGPVSVASAGDTLPVGESRAAFAAAAAAYNRAVAAELDARIEANAARAGRAGGPAKEEPGA